jgi:hypothetical protein
MVVVLSLVRGCQSVASASFTPLLKSMQIGFEVEGKRETSQVIDFNLRAGRLFGFQSFAAIF